MKLSKAAKAARTCYIKEWDKKNRKKRKEYNRRYWERKAATPAMDSVTDNITVRRNTDTLKDSVTCQNCRQSFSPQRSTAKFCSDSCRVAYNRKK